MLTRNAFIAGLFVAISASLAVAQPAAKPATEDDFYRMVTFPLPKDVVLEVGGMDWLDAEKTRLAVCTRRGEVWVLDNVYTDNPALAGTKVKVQNEDGKTVEVEATAAQIVSYKRMLFGLHEPLGMVVNPKDFPKGIYMVQRSELTRVEDTNGDDLIDMVQTFSNGWEVSGSYHEYAFGPKIGNDGQLWITLNRPFGGGQEGTAYWRGWAVKVDSKGKMTPICPGLRSPAGLGTNMQGEMFFTDNQGDHVASGKLAHIKPGVFHGNPVGLESCKHPLSNFTKPNKDYPKLDLPWAEAVPANPHLQAPAVWFPYPNMGRSQTDIVWDKTKGKFGPFAGQMFVGDLSNAIVMRVMLEEVDGEYQGVAFPFRRGFRPPVLRMEWGKDGSMFVGGSSRGWGGGAQSYGLARLTWTGKTPFEIHEMKATPKGFRLTFTKTIDQQTAKDIKSYALECWTHKYYSRYGDDQQDKQTVEIAKVEVEESGKAINLTLAKQLPYYIHALKLPGIRSTDGEPLLHNEAFYTLNRIPRK
jgi:hypothetical protein